MIRGLGTLVRGSERLALRVRLGRELDVAIWERPGRWMSDDELAELVARMRAVAAAGQGGKPVPLYGALAGDRGELGERVVTMVFLRGTGAPIAFSALRYLDLDLAGTRERVVHLGLAYVDGAHRGHGLSAVLYGLANFLLFFRSGMRRFWVSNVTQVPAVFGLVAEHYDDVFPSHRPGARQRFAHLQRARAIMRHHRAAFGVGDDAGFDEAAQVITNAYTGGSDELKKSFAEAPKHRLPAVNELCRLALDYERGDDFLQLAVWNLGATVRFLEARAPRASTLRLVVAAVLLVFVSVVVPIGRWLIPPVDERDDEREARR